jgi:hypothetical protein
MALLETNLLTFHVSYNLPDIIQQLISSDPVNSLGKVYDIFWNQHYYLRSEWNDIEVNDLSFRRLIAIIKDNEIHGMPICKMVLWILSVLLPLKFSLLFQNQENVTLLIQTMVQTSLEFDLCDNPSLEILQLLIDTNTVTCSKIFQIGTK